MTQLAAQRLSPDDHARASAEGTAFVARVETVLDRIARTRTQSETLGRVPDSAVAAMREAGVFRALTPRRFGGLEMAPARLFEGMMRIAGADSSAAWIGGQMNVHSFEIALMHPKMQEEFWSDGPDTSASSSYALIGTMRAVEGGFVRPRTRPRSCPACWAGPLVSKSPAPRPKAGTPARWWGMCPRPPNPPRWRWRRGSAGASCWPP